MPTARPRMSLSEAEAEAEIDVNLDMSRDELYKVNSIEREVTGNLLPVCTCSLGRSYPARKV